MRHAKTTAVTAAATDKEALIQAAREARARAYAPYSNYTVGAALITESGEIITGCNVENAVYPASICAERVAITRAVADGHRDLPLIVVATRNGGTPCGICRQVMAEFNPDMTVIIVSDNQVVGEYNLRDLLPYSFGAADLDA
jgi:cytidine deaminase